MHEMMESKQPNWKSYNKQNEINDDLVYIPIGKSFRQKSEQDIYNESALDRVSIHDHAIYASKNTAKPFSSHEEIVDIAKERDVKFGPFGLFSKTEKYIEKNRIQVPDDFWVLESRFFYKRETNGSDEFEECHSYKYCLHKDGHLFHRTEVENTFIYRKEGRAGTTKDKPDDRKLTDHDIMTLDYSPKYISSDDGKGEVIHGDWNRGDLLYKKKGEGLIAFIDKLLE